jgi:hypothetical protein
MGQVIVAREASYDLGDVVSDRGYEELMAAARVFMASEFSSKLLLAAAQRPATPAGRLAQEGRIRSFGMLAVIFCGSAKSRPTPDT